MEKRNETKMRHKEWRRIVKKERRRRLRRATAQQRDADEERLRAALNNTVEYLKWCDEQERFKKETEARERREHEEREKQWLEEEVRARKEWQALQQKKEEEKQKQLEEQRKMAEELEAKKEAFRKKEEEHRRKRKELLRKREQLQKDINDYIENRAKTPEALREVNETQPGKDLCPFFMKTGACRYGDKCSKNHRIVFLSKVILIHGFYSHFSLEKNSAEYDTDVTLEYETSETWQHYREFYEDVISELKTYGRINVVRCCCNTEAHLRGNLYVEYHTEREATRAWKRLNGRWYAGKQLKCEFANLKSWRSAICGMTKCPKGTACNYLHTFRNPRDEYSIKEARRMKNTPQISNSKRSERRRKSRWEESVRTDSQEERDWRWSESPEIELEPRTNDAEEKRTHVPKKERSHRSSHDGSESSLRSLNSSRRSRSPEERHRSKNRKRSHDDDEETASDGRSSKKRKKKSKRRNDNENDHKKARRN
ncbi:PREDICTED: U2 small nuclear ribonucleoprotein auxiliary factor 35 kDa subunit-related protein 2 isoform X2 [Dinoponera quadriceps]|uniref:U2 small nuclear ribonucleoprotein auxiliary factor 35 kDa subunit-related protein 2 isoform X2 n=1 Tax=Dinoponera quadriceps TaxID=609295 RepID=A0A6P3WSW1_DINQU|nr:PREDICTED: U2 small nuclear ribonucleoprotein auxiliary factor 35 kDa subunit-related protein 2 isoform X2 [Dinoponera quadriceps]